MKLTMWTNVATGKRLTRSELSELRRRARQVYEANPHIFEDELEALWALGVQPLVELGTMADGPSTGSSCSVAEMTAERAVTTV